MHKKIILTGGHAATAALAVVAELEKIKSPIWEIIWVGSKKAVEGKSLTTFTSFAEASNERPCLFTNSPVSSEAKNAALSKAM